ncbi:LysR family transcriptional regulator [Acinetobacter pittii]|uniref:LysR family transcriptional regulator n=1 Tax=Acinetobacter pittii TaxID=48296 RepID=UPI0019810D1C|nr:LysR family transcriptional regulator [Acinetobacter pittii]MBN6523282.1 LysR family transcriptional regulator [Acinetobacter pittii]
MSYLHESRIKFFYEAVKKGGVRAAADFLNVAPSAVSRQISQLEQELAVTLVERHRRGIKPTEAGEEVLNYYRAYLIQQDLLLDNLQALQGLQTGHIYLAIGEGYIEDISSVLGEFSSKFPGIKLHLTICSTNEVIRKITEDEAHIGVVFNPSRDPKIRSHVSIDHPLSIIVNKHHELNKQENSIELNQLNNYRLALTDVSHGIRQIISQAENNVGIVLTPTLVCNNLATLKTYAHQGGVTLLPSFLIKNSPDLTNLPLHNPIFSQTKTHLITRLGRQLGNGANQLLKLLVYKFQERN